MDRQACVDLPAFPLQLQLLKKPEWRRYPCAIIDQDKPQGELLWVSALARQHRILPGMRYSSALALCRELRAAEVPATTIAQAIHTLSANTLTAFSPRVEALSKEPGVFWLDLSGLERLFPSFEDWASKLQQRLQQDGWVSRIVVGWDRFSSYAIAKATQGIQINDTSEEERYLAASVRLADLGIDPKMRDALDDLSVLTLGEFVALPREGVERRFGRSARELHEQATGEREPPMQAQSLRFEVCERVFLEHSVRNLEQLLKWVESLLVSALVTLAHRSELAQGIEVELRLENRGAQSEQLRTAEATNDPNQWLELLRLRLEDCRLHQGVQEIILKAQGKAMQEGQTELFATEARRDLAAANRALARIRAEFGGDAVQIARPNKGHLPEAQFVWRSLDRLSEANPPRIFKSVLVRRLFAKPKPLPPRPRQEPDGWLLRGLTDSPVDRVRGPFIISGGWWRREIHREYHFAETRKGDLLWFYYDRIRRRWFLHGRVE